MKVQIKTIFNHPLPEYATDGSAGMDLCARLDMPVIILPNERVKIPVGIMIELPVGYEAQIRPRSGLAWKKGITIPNAPGTIDSDFRGEIEVILLNQSKEAVIIGNMDRIAQMVVAKYERVEWEQVYGELSETERGGGGFGSTGI